MNHFWESSDTIGKGLGFSHFDACHLFWLSLFVCTVLLNVMWYRRMGETGRRRWRIAVASLIVVDELYKIIGLAAFGRYTLDYLPLHLCSINIILIAIHAVKPSRLLDNFLYGVCIPAALMALLFPTWTKLPMANFMHLHSFTVHILLAMYPIVLFAAGDIRPRARQIPRCLLFLIALAIPIYGFNVLFDTNFMFLISASKGNPLSWFETHWGSHLLGFPVLVPVVLAVMYLPLEGIRRYRQSIKSN